MRIFDFLKKFRNKKTDKQGAYFNHSNTSSFSSAAKPMNNVETFKDTLRRIELDPLLSSRTEHSVQGTVLIFPHTFSEKTPISKDTKVLVKEATTLQATRELCRKYHRVALLNFANPIEPGGGVWRGANAQEESLCRAGSLYPCLANEETREYYRRHQKMRGYESVFWGTDCLLYSPDVTFFKEEVPLFSQDDILQYELRYSSNWFTADVITCAAPYFSNQASSFPHEELSDVLIGRIQNILESAIDHDIEALVLGAFGCGAFHNPPMIVADAFRSVLLQPRYRNAFDEIWFAVKRTAPFFCPNIEAFETKLSAFPEENLISEERNKRRFFE